MRGIRVPSVASPGLPERMDTPTCRTQCSHITGMGTASPKDEKDRPMTMMAKTAPHIPKWFLHRVLWPAFIRVATSVVSRALLHHFFSSAASPSGFSTFFTASVMNPVSNMALRIRKCFRASSSFQRLPQVQLRFARKK